MAVQMTVITTRSIISLSDCINMPPGRKRCRLLLTPSHAPNQTEQGLLQRENIGSATTLGARSQLPTDFDRRENKSQATHTEGNQGILIKIQHLDLSARAQTRIQRIRK